MDEVAWSAVCLSSEQDRIEVTSSGQMPVDLKVAMNFAYRFLRSYLEAGNFTSNGTVAATPQAKIIMDMMKEMVLNAEKLCFDSESFPEPCEYH